MSVPTVWLTMDDLKREEACAASLHWFEEHYGTGTPITRAFLERVCDHNDSWLDWLADLLCPSEHDWTGDHRVCFICDAASERDLIDGILLCTQGEP
jgi:hypothetical protein